MAFISGTPGQFALAGRGATPGHRTHAACSVRAVTPVASAEAVATEPQKAAQADEPFFGRVITAMVTPFKPNGQEVDYAVMEQLASYLSSNGSDALVVGGTTGESPTLSWSENTEIFSVVKQAVGPNCKVIGGAGSNSTKEAVEATKRAAQIGIDGTLQVCPYYSKPGPEGQYRHFKAIAECEPDLPVMLYNIPGRCGVNMAADTTVRLSEIDNVIAIKEAAGDIDQFVDIRKRTHPDFHLYSGDDSLTLPLMALGGSGVVSVASHFIGPQIKEMIEKFLGGKPAEATALHLKYSQLFNDLFILPNPVPSKTALRLQGFPVGPVRLPLTDADAEVERHLTKLLSELKLL